MRLSANKAGLFGKDALTKIEGEVGSVKGGEHKNQGLVCGASSYHLKYHIS